MNVLGLRSQLSTDSSDEEEEDLPFTFEDFEEDFEDFEEDYEERGSRPENPHHKLLNESQINEDNNHDEERLGNKRSRSSDSTSTDQVLTSSGERWEFNKNPSFFMRRLNGVCNTTAPHLENTFSPCHMVPVKDNVPHSTPLNDKIEKEFLRMDIDNCSLAPSSCMSPTNHSTKKTKLSGIENTLNCELELSHESTKKWADSHI